MAGSKRGAGRGRGQETVFHIVSYDIPSDRRRARVHKLLKGFGEWVQYSVFECYLTSKQLLQLHSRLRRVIKEEEDHIRIYALCAPCEERADVIGGARPEEKQAYVV